MLHKFNRLHQTIMQWENLKLFGKSFIPNNDLSSSASQSKNLHLGFCFSAFSWKWLRFGWSFGPWEYSQKEKTIWRMWLEIISFIKALFFKRATTHISARIRFGPCSQSNLAKCCKYLKKGRYVSVISMVSTFVENCQWQQTTSTQECTRWKQFFWRLREQIAIWSRNSLTIGDASQYKSMRWERIKVVLMTSSLRNHSQMRNNPSSKGKHKHF